MMCGDVFEVSLKQLAMPSCSDYSLVVERPAKEARQCVPNCSCTYTGTISITLLGATEDTRHTVREQTITGCFTWVRLPPRVQRGLAVLLGPEGGGGPHHTTGLHAVVQTTATTEWLAQC